MAPIREMLGTFHAIHRTTAVDRVNWSQFSILNRTPSDSMDCGDYHNYGPGHLLLTGSHNAAVYCSYFTAATAATAATATATTVAPIVNARMRPAPCCAL